MLASLQTQPEIGRTSVALVAQPDCAEVNKAWMMIDLVDSTSWYVSLDKKTAFRLLRSCLQRMGDVVKRYKGRIVKLTGDGLHASFDDPLDALQCAVAYQESMISTKDHPDCRLPRARVGLSVGTCIQCELFECVDYYGYAVLLATRLAQQGRRDEVVMSKEFASQPEIASLLKTVNVETQLCCLKGFPRPLRCYRIDARELYQWTRSNGKVLNSHQVALGD